MNHLNFPSELVFLWELKQWELLSCPTLAKHCSAVSSASPGDCCAHIWVPWGLRGIFKANGPGRRKCLGTIKLLSTWAPPLGLQAGAGFHCCCVYQEKPKMYKPCMCLNHHSSPRASALQAQKCGHTSSWEFHRWVLALRGVCTKTWNPSIPNFASIGVCLHISKGCCSLFGIKTLIPRNLHD